MRDNIVKYLLIVSVILNLSFLGGAGYTYYKQSTYRHPPTMHELHMGGAHLFQSLALKPEQLKAFQEKALPFHQQMANKREEVDRLRGTLFSLMRANHPDEKAIEATIAQIDATQREMQKTIVTHMLEFKSMLNAEQQKRFLDMVEGAMAQQRQDMCP
jgi:Spy/CpxP family protein refolding chaperone